MEHKLVRIQDIPIPVDVILGTIIHHTMYVYHDVTNPLSSLHLLSIRAEIVFAVIADAMFSALLTPHNRNSIYCLRILHYIKRTS